MRITLAFDSFKGSVTSGEAASAAAEGIRSFFPDAEIRQFIMADGGEGTIEAISSAVKCTSVETMARNPVGEVITCRYLVTEDGTAVIELAEASGLTLIPEERRNPMYTSTSGTGDMIADAISKGYRKFVLFIGGSATNDAGTGILSALGYRFLDRDGKELKPSGKILADICEIDVLGACDALTECSFTIASDVTNPFYGADGAAYVFAPQKGASEEEVKMLDKGLRHFCDIIRKQTGKDISGLPGAGAAGGVGGGLAAFLDTDTESGAETVMRITGIGKEISTSDIVVTGEGCTDRQSCFGKAVGMICRCASDYSIPSVVLSGKIDLDRTAREQLGATAVFSIQDGPADMAGAMLKKNALENIRRSAGEAASLFFHNRTFTK